MDDELKSLAAPVNYKDRRIVLSPEEHADGTWTCYYSIIEHGHRPSESNQDQPQGVFPSREAAELAALQKAKALIDL